MAILLKVTHKRLKRKEKANQSRAGKNPELETVLNRKNTDRNIDKGSPFKPHCNNSFDTCVEEVKGTPRR